MEQKRLFLYSALIAVLVMLWQAWQTDYAAPPRSAPTPPILHTDAPSQAIRTQASLTPQSVAATPSPATTNLSPSTNTSPSSMITVRTDVIEAKIDPLGGDIISLELLHYPQSLENSKLPIKLLNENPLTLNGIQTGLISNLGPDTDTQRALYHTDHTHYQLSPSQTHLEIPLTWETPQGIKVKKVFTFKPGHYDISLTHEIQNLSPQTWTGQFYAQLKQKPLPSSGGFFGLQTYQGGALSTPDSAHEKISFSDMKKKDLGETVQGGWLAMQQRYFLTALIPDRTSHYYYSRFDPTSDIYTLGYVGEVIHLPAHATHTLSTTLYAGPEVAEVLQKIAPKLDLTIDYGWLWPISIGIFKVMKLIYHLVGNWGWSIVLVTLLIKLLFYQLSATSYRSMAKMRRVTPQLQAIKERFLDDKMKLNQAMMEFYKKEKINPLSGCLPMLIQVPFFIALYYVLIESVELRQAPFIGWIKDLSIRDPYFVLPVLMGLSMFLQQRLNPPSPDPLQAKIMLFLPVLFTVFFATFPAGLVLYWLVNNCAGALQQWYIMKKMQR